MQRCRRRPLGARSGPRSSRGACRLRWRPPGPDPRPPRTKHPAYTVSPAAGWDGTLSPVRLEVSTASAWAASTRRSAQIRSPSREHHHVTDDEILGRDVELGAVADDGRALRQQIAEALGRVLGPRLPATNANDPLSRTTTNTATPSSGRPATNASAPGAPEQQREEVHHLGGEPLPRRGRWGNRQHVRTVGAPARCGLRSAQAARGTIRSGRSALGAAVERAGLTRHAGASCGPGATTVGGSRGSRAGPRSSTAAPRWRRRRRPRAPPPRSPRGRPSHRGPPDVGPASAGDGPPGHDGTRADGPAGSNGPSGPPAGRDRRGAGAPSAGTGLHAVGDAGRIRDLRPVSRPCRGCRLLP